jgi:hypothetical protein
MLGRIAFVLCLAPLAFAGAPAQRSQPSITGEYASNYDRVSLVQDGDRVSGTYVCCGGGTIEGRIVEKRTVRYRWKQPGSEGFGVWTIRNGRLDGTWGNGQSDRDGGRWDLTPIQVRNKIAN